MTGHLCIKGSLKANNRRCLGCQAEPSLLFLFPVQLTSRQHFEVSETRDRTKRRNPIGAYYPYGALENIKYEPECEVSRMGTFLLLLLLPFLLLLLLLLTTIDF